MRIVPPIVFGLSSCILAGCGTDTPTTASTAAIAGSASTELPAVAPGDWPTYNRTLAGDRFSPLDEITAQRGAVAPCAPMRCPRSPHCKPAPS
jgi:glucose dehydrogenase